MTDSLAPTPPTKPGYLTTEFYGSWAVKILGALMTTGVLGDGTQASRIVGAVLVILGLFGYTASRTVVKAAAALFLACLLAGPQLACSSSARQREAAGVGAFMACEASAFPAGTLADATDLAKVAVMDAIAGSGSADAARLKADAAPLKTSLLRCAWDAAVAALAAPPPPATPGAPAAAELVVDGAALRARWAQARAELGWPPGRT